ncbi:hypothetical protein GIB67_027409 [Kingdonia uniflora]|uniref:AAA+ ATPase domain-containing protein n=1 Tax=Kingdonia uniflora TaxID=39325 RepID=A0A7J7MFF0_9MAGN|nr:hypothetical protein GIB67_027409 [Kingdonia uniflora]
MPSLIENGSFITPVGVDDNLKRLVKVEKCGDSVLSTKKDDSSPNRRQTRSETMVKSPVSSPMQHCFTPIWKSPRRCMNSSPSGNKNGKRVGSETPLLKSAQKSLSDDSEQMSAVKEAIHVSSVPPAIFCREEEQKRVFEFCKSCIEQQKGGSLYVCGCPGTGKTLSMDKVKQLLLTSIKEEGLQLPDVLVMNCTTLAKTSDIFSKILEMLQPGKKTTGALLPLQHLQKLFSQKQQSSCQKMLLIFADELDYLITKDRSVLHDLFMLTTLLFSRCILIGIANAIDLADRFLPKLHALNCKPMVITFRAYSKEQILRILQQRLMFTFSYKALPYDVFHPQALELCARKVAAASGDMRKALCVCRSAIEMLEVEINLSLAENASHGERITPETECCTNKELNIVRVDIMVIALSRTFQSPIVDTIQSLPQHQQVHSQ